MGDEGTPQARARSGAAEFAIQGGMIGDNNVQHNWFKERELDARRVEHLSAHDAARYVAALNAEDAAFVLAIADSSRPRVCSGSFSQRRRSSSWQSCL